MIPWHKTTYNWAGYGLVVDGIVVQGYDINNADYADKIIRPESWTDTFPAEYTGEYPPHKQWIPNDEQLPPAWNNTRPNIYWANDALLLDWYDEESREAWQVLSLDYEAEYAINWISSGDFFGTRQVGGITYDCYYPPGLIGEIVYSADLQHISYGVGMPVNALVPVMSLGLLSLVVFGAPFLRIKGCQLRADNPIPPPPPLNQVYFDSSPLLVLGDELYLQ